MLSIIYCLLDWTGNLQEWKPEVQLCLLGIDLIIFSLWAIANKD